MQKTLSDDTDTALTSEQCAPLDERERVMVDTIEKHIAEQNRKGSVSGLTDREITQIRRQLNGGDAA